MWFEESEYIKKMSLSVISVYVRLIERMFIYNVIDTSFRA